MIAQGFDSAPSMKSDALLGAQGFHPAPLALLKYSPDQPRVPAGQGRESGQWTSDDASGLAPGGPEAFAGDGADASIILVSNEKERNYEEGRARGEESPKEDIEHDRPIPLYPEGPLALPPPAAGAVHREPSPKVDPNKLHHLFRTDKFHLHFETGMPRNEQGVIHSFSPG